MEYKDDGSGLYLQITAPLKTDAAVELVLPLDSGHYFLITTFAGSS
jgi:hypothetical protein